MLKALREKIDDPNVIRIYLTTFGLGVAYGMAISVIAIFLDKRGFQKTDIGSLAAWFAAGLVAASIPSGRLIARLSAKTTLVAGLVLYATTVTLFPFAHSYELIAALRFFDGVASVCVWVASETILLARAERSVKAYVTSLYAMSIAVGYITGPVLSRGAAALMDLKYIFIVAGGLSLLVALYTAIKLDPGSDRVREGPHEGELPAAERAPLSTLLNRIKMSCFATFAYGYFQASVVLFLPIFLRNDKGIAEERTLVIPAFFAFGMLLFTNVAGRLGDRYGHLAVMRLLAVVGSCTVAGFVWLDSYFSMCAAVFLAGVSLASISPLSLALQGLVTREYGRATSIYNAFYACGMLFGPPVSGLLFDRRGGGTMLYHLAALWALFVVSSIVFRRDDPRTTPRYAQAVLPVNGAS